MAGGIGAVYATDQAEIEPEPEQEIHEAGEINIDETEEPEFHEEGVFETSAFEYDAIDRFVSRMYLDVLARGYDIDGLVFWADHIRNSRLTGANFAHSAFFSPEFIGQRVSDTEFINRMYMGLMDRDPDPDGREFWLAHMRAGLPRENIFENFVNSNEFTGHCGRSGIVRGTYVPPPGGLARVFAKRFFTIALEREPQQYELDHWHNLLKSGISGASAAFDIIFGLEMNNRNLTNDQFIDILYRLMLGRASDPAGKEDWMKYLEDGNSRHALFNNFVATTEFERICRDHGVTRGTSPLSPVNPTQLAGRIIFLDPGHGTIGSPGWASYNEAVAMLGLAGRIKPMLEARGATVIMTRTDEINIPISQRCAMINIRAMEEVKLTRTDPVAIAEIDRLIDVMRSIIADPNGNGPVYMNLDPFRPSNPIHPDLQRIFEITNDPVVRDNFLVISLHSNATGPGGVSGVRGAEVYYISPAENSNSRLYYPDFSFSSRSRHFADILLDHIQLAGIPRRSNGLRAANYAMIREINIPSVLTENGFHTNPDDRALLSNPDFMNRLANEYVNAIARYFG